MKTLHGIEPKGLIVAALASLALVAPARANEKPAPATAVLGFTPHPACEGRPLDLHVGTKVLRGHVCTGNPDQAFLDLLRDFGMFLENLPVEELERIAISPAWIDLDFAGKEARKIVLRGHDSLALAPKDARRPLAGGRLFRNEAEDFRLCLANVVRLNRDPKGGIRGVREGDIEVKYGAWFDLELRTLRAPRRMAKDAEDRILLVKGPDGHPLLDARGNYVPQVFDCWVVVEVDTAFKDVELALGVPPSPAASSNPVAVSMK